MEMSQKKKNTNQLNKNYNDTLEVKSAVYDVKEAPTLEWRFLKLWSNIYEVYYFIIAWYEHIWYTIQLVFPSCLKLKITFLINFVDY